MQTQLKQSDTGTEIAAPKLRNYVDGGWVIPQTEDYLDVTNPANGEVIAQVPLSTKEDTDAAVAAAQAAFPGWRATPPLERARLLFAVKARMEERFEDLAHAVTREHGKTLEDARGSVRRAIENVEVACGIPSLLMGYGLEDGAAKGIDEDVVRQPLGVFAAVCPFNFPADGAVLVLALRRGLRQYVHHQAVGAGADQHAARVRGAGRLRLSARRDQRRERLQGGRGRTAR